MSERATGFPAFYYKHGGQGGGEQRRFDRRNNGIKVQKYFDSQQAERHEKIGNTDLKMRIRKRRENNMCCTTKIKITDALRELMLERPLRKITVQDIMERTHMKRQSFYYHFRDVYDVLEWEIKRRLGEKLQYDPSQNCETWCLTVLGELERDRIFYHKTVQALGVKRSVQYIKRAIELPICSLLLEQPDPDLARLTDEQIYMLEFFGRSLCSELISRVQEREPMALEYSRRRIQILCRMAEQCAQMPRQLFSTC